MTYFLPDKAYDVLKWVGLVFCPALAVFVGTVGPGLGIPDVDQAVTLINAIGIFIGGLIGVSQATARER